MGWLQYLTSISHWSLGFSIFLVSQFHEHWSIPLGNKAMKSDEQAPSAHSLSVVFTYCKNTFRAQTRVLHCRVLVRAQSSAASAVAECAPGRGAVKPGTAGQGKLPAIGRNVWVGILRSRRSWPGDEHGRQWKGLHMGTEVGHLSPKDSSLGNHEKAGRGRTCWEEMHQVTISIQTHAQRTTGKRNCKN